MKIFLLILIFWYLFIKNNNNGDLHYSQVYCKKCNIWYIPKDIQSTKYCPKCNSRVHGDE